jgi:type II secretory pathway component GspD/PulD (secretin)
MNVGRALVALALVWPASLFGFEPSPSCPVDGRVSVSAHAVPVREFLRDVAEQSKASLAVEPQLRGEVTLDASCVDVRTALRLALGQVGAVFCESGDVIYVSRRSRARCARPQPVVQRVERSPAEEDLLSQERSSSRLQRASARAAAGTSPHSAWSEAAEPHGR